MRGWRQLRAVLAVAVVTCCGCASGPRAALPIETARHAPPGTTVTVEGFVTVPSGLFASFTGDQSLAIEDSTGGIYVALSEESTAQIAERVRVTGQMADIARLVVLSSRPERVQPLPRRHLVQPETVRTGIVGPVTEGKLVRIRGTVTRPIGDDRPYGYKIYVDDGSGEVQVFVPVSTGIDPSAEPVLRAGRVLTVVGFS